MQPIQATKGWTADGRPLVQTDRCGAVFVPDPARRVTMPVWSYGEGPAQEVMFSCPVSAIPDAVWQLLDLWLTCRAMHALPKPGGVLDQPVIVRRAWPIFEAEMEPVERKADQAAAMSAAAALMATLFGKR